MSLVHCPSFPSCSGCDNLNTPYVDQILHKKAELQNLLIAHDLEFPEIEFLSAGESALRDRLDFVWESGRLGLFSHSEKRILDLPECSQLSPALSAWYLQFREYKWPIKKGSLRLRIGPQGQKGVWLDFANLDIKNLIDERVLLTKLLKICHVEIGQKRKTLGLQDGNLKLLETQFHPWFSTQYGSKSLDLYCQVASFTQPSMKANQLIGKTLSKWAEHIKAKKVIEFGAGVGNLSFPIAFFCDSLLACESDQMALLAFQMSLSEFEKKHQLNLKDKFQFLSGDFQLNHSQRFQDFDLILVNPPRSGLKDFLQPLAQEAKKPNSLIYMSCFPESYAFDAQKIKALGYQMRELVIVDQFPQTKHYEILSWWQAS